VERDVTPDRPRIGVVVGEGHAARRGLLRFVLEGEGFLVLADAASTVELVQALAVHRPEVVVLDDAIGSTAVVLTREMCPDAKIVLVWPTDLAPISGDATVDPTQVLRELGPAVQLACGRPEPEPAAATVQSMTSRVRPERPSRPSSGLADVLPGPGVARSRELAEDEPVIVDREPAPILILPVSPLVERDPQH
jgi:CheY-like chemotaxis protein